MIYRSSRASGGGHARGAATPSSPQWAKQTRRGGRWLRTLHSSGEHLHKWLQLLNNSHFLASSCMVKFSFIESVGSLRLFLNPP